MGFDKKKYRKEQQKLQKQIAKKVEEYAAARPKGR